MLNTLTCPSCHASLDLPETLTQPTIKCPYCDTTVIVPEDLRQSMQGTASANSEAAIQEIMRLIQNGQKINAIKKYREVYGVDLKTAKDAVDALEMGWQVASGTVVYNTPTVKVQTGGCAGGIVTIVLLLVILGAVGVFYFARIVPSQGDVSEMINVISEEVDQISDITLPGTVQVNGPALLLPVGDGVIADLAYVSWDYDAEVMYVSYLVGETGTQRWQSEAVQGEVGGVSLFAGEKAIYFVAESELTALDRQNGRILWHTTLSDRLPYVCEGCLLTFDNYLVVQSLDNALVGLDGATGEQVWQLEPTATSPQGLYRVDDWFGLLTEDENSDGRFDLLDPTSGNLMQRLEPRCAHPSFSAQSPSDGDPLVIDESEKSIYFFFGFFDPKCVQRWNYETNTLTWNTAVEDSLPPTDAVLLQDSNQLYYNTSDHQLFAVNKADGTVKLLVEDDGYTLIPLDARNKIVLVKAVRTQGSTREEIWGVDANDGRVLWEVVPQAQEEIGVFSNVSVVHPGDDGYWSAHMTLSGVYLLQMRPDPPRLVLETIGLRDGVSSGQTDLPTGTGADMPYWVSLNGWDDEFVWLTMDLKEIWGIDPAKVEIVTQGP